MGRIKLIWADKNRVTVKNSFRTNLPVKCRPSVGRLLAVCRSTVGRLSVVWWPTIGQLSAAVDCLPTVVCVQLHGVNERPKLQAKLHTEQISFYRVMLISKRGVSHKVVGKWRQDKCLFGTSILTDELNDLTKSLSNALRCQTWGVLRLILKPFKTLYLLFNLNFHNFIWNQIEFLHLFGKCVTIY